MCPTLDQKKPERLGSWGHIGKSIARSSYVLNIKNDHEFMIEDVDQSISASAPSGLVGFALFIFRLEAFEIVY